MKLFSTKELVKQLKEYDDYSLYILKSIYGLLSSENTHNRLCGAKLLYTLDIFDYFFEFKLEGSSSTTDYVYLQFKELQQAGQTDTNKQKSEIKKILALDHVETEFLDNKDIQLDGSINIVLKTAESKEKNIENIFDFFEAINLILLSPDWFKRHGGFIAYCAIIASSAGWNFDVDILEQPKEMEDNGKRGNTERKNHGRTKVTLGGDIFNKIFEILKNDKFNDFQGDVTSSPVKEAASVLLKYIYPMLNNKLILHEVTHLLVSEDWQEQFSGLLALSQLKEHFTQDLIDGTGLLENFLEMLVTLLDSYDEDVKFHSADLLSFIMDNFKVDELTVKRIKDSCWNLVENDIDIAHSKASILILLKSIYSKTQQEPPASFSCLYPCFTSPTAIVRDSALHLTIIFDGEEFLYLLSEGVLLENNGVYKHLKILLDKIAKTDKAVLIKFADHFFKILSRSLYIPYSEDDFACYDDIFFTPDGIKSIGSTVVLDNRAALLRVLLEIEGIGPIDGTAILGSTMKELYLLKHSKVTVEQQTKRLKEEGKQWKLDEDAEQSLEEAMKMYSPLKKMPLKEFKAIISNPFHYSLFPLCIENCTDFIRLVACRGIKRYVEFDLYFRLESSRIFLEVFSETVIQATMSTMQLESIVENTAQYLIKSSNMLKEEEDSIAKPLKKQVEKGPVNTQTYASLVLEQSIKNATIFFEILGRKLLDLNVFNIILKGTDRLAFFRHTVGIYVDDSRIDEVFEEALEKKHIKTLKKLISAMRYNCLFVRKVLETADIALLSELIDVSDPTFNILFVKLILKSTGSDASRSLLSKVLCTLHFGINSAIKDEYLLAMLEKEKDEVRMIVDPEQIKEYPLEIEHSIELRSYQKEGIKWISFLNRFGLNGILADDMGLGKTVQVLCFILNEMYLKGKLKKEELHVKEAIRNSKMRVLILCPSSLSFHWKDEMLRFFKVTSSVYEIKKGIQSQNIIICSYDSFRRDNVLETIHWDFVVFDEGHVLKNRKTVLFTKCKKLHANSKIILTGTPIHNSVDDLFSIFDIMMPGYLGSEDSFSSQYSCRVTDKNVQQMEARLQALHKKTLPFILRRLKSEVLKDLPPKVIKDLCIEMSQEQTDLYKRISQDEDERDYSSGYTALKNNTLVKIRDCLKASSHPFYFNKAISSTKTATLLEIFSMCENSKILVFFQLKSTIDFVLEETGIKNALRLDGTIPVLQRSEVVSKFNSEAIPYLFLTTSIGGLGLNLTSADVVVFYEHDWNPFNDLQAMDRAHRLGQKKTVNVFRLICKNTVEEKVMNYQNFKLYVAGSIITQQNNEIKKMDTKDLLERFQE
ncbi:TATA-binding protein-associated factor mot1 [Glugoides intestinalis]